MARCAYCNTVILFGGVKDQDLRFCNETCHKQGHVLLIAREVPEDLVAEQVAQLHEGPCPKCGGPGPVDVHTSHLVWSALVMTSWKSVPQVCCRSCGIKAKVWDTLLSGLFGWWGFPWGLIFTPIQIGRNVVGMFSSPDPEIPSDQLEKNVRLALAEQFVAGNHPQEPEDKE